MKGKMIRQLCFHTLIIDSTQKLFVFSNPGNKKSSKKQFPNDMIFSAIASMFPENGVPDDMKER